MKVLCFYHGNCADGFGAAWVVRKFMKERQPGNTVKFIAATYQKTDPIAAAKEFFGDTNEPCHVVIVDFSFPLEQTIALLDVCSVTHIDHHRTAIDAHASLDHPKLTKYYDIERSGAMLAWNYYFDLAEPPPLLRHIEDRDLWKFALEGTREIQADLFSYPYDFEVWDKLMQRSTDFHGLEQMRLAGAAIERKHFKDIHELLNITVRPMVIGGFDMPVANLPYTFSSDAGHILAEFAVNKCAACYWDTPEGRVFSLRSRDDGPDVSAIAKQYGGGGHPHAAGFKVDPRTAMKFEKLLEPSIAQNVWGQFTLDNVIPF